MTPAALPAPPITIPAGNVADINRHMTGVFTELSGKEKTPVLYAYLS